MRGILGTLCLVAIAAWGLSGAGRRPTTAESCIDSRAPQLGIDRNPLGPQNLHECRYDLRCPVGAAGWRREDTCARCPIQHSETQAGECQAEFACKLSSGVYSLCGDACMPRTSTEPRP